ncbi:transcription initiation factor IIF subunit alpha isoform X1 [Cynara cardunculus var. scolymus]|uniref:transcription initiation factor IIF subunit alpha isoform X1 n=1 Tax=Cynara cardunculus var. scolymus TaxID=59895 RepID=UPI000D6247A5|nr:transcription initiation factor IIF subunit alpha isoform X1 [Cynara cardunculus var. scolymus]
MSFDLMLKQSCDGCRSTVELYGSNCKHMTLCVTCGKTMAERKDKCRDCGATITRLIREYNVRASSASDKNYFIGRFVTGLPSFSKKKNDNKWSLQKEGLQGRQITDTLREKYKNKPWLLEDETGQFQYQGVLEGAQTATYYLLMLQGKEFVAIPAGSWYNFNKVAQYKQLTLEEAEEKIKNRRKTADGYQRWMMKAANNGAAAFGEVERFDDKEAGGAGAAGGRGRKKNNTEDEEANVSDRGEEDEDEESARKNRLGLNKRGGDDDEEGPRGGDLDFDDDDIEKGDDWEHEEIFTDDDEAVGNDPEEREDLAPEIPAPPEIKQDEEDEEENEEEEGGLSQSGKELKKLLGKNNGVNESEPEQEDDDDDDDDIEDESSPVLAPKPNNASSKRNNPPKEEPVDSSPSKPASTGSARGTPSSSKSSKGKRKSSDEAKPANGAAPKKVKTENEVKPVKDDPVSTSKSSAPTKGASSSKPAVSPSTGPVTEDEIRAVLLHKAPVTTQDLVAKFKSRLRSKEDKSAFADILRRISKIQKTNGPSYVVLRDK